jgi:hypothetical protein
VPGKVKVTCLDDYRPVALTLTLMLSPLLYFLFTHDCVAAHNSNTIIQFAEDTTMVCLITNNDETVYRLEFSDLSVLCQDNNLSLYISKTKDLIVYYRT